jgi:ribosomal protein S18 acetylase RimI-like enzyme
VTLPLPSKATMLMESTTSKPAKAEIESTPTPPSSRLATLADVPILHKLINEAYRTNKGWTHEQGLVGGERITVQALESQILDNIDPILVAETFILTDALADQSQDTRKAPKPAATTAAQVVGCISFELSDRHQHLELPPHSALLGLLAVNPELQSLGIGKFLMKSVIDLVKNDYKCTRAIIWVLEKRLDIQAWYERLGFRWHGELKEFVWPEMLLQPSQFKIYEQELM